MTSYVLIELDTTPPDINIYVPSYTTNDLTNEIIIESNESLSNYQEVYVIDSNGDKHDYVFEKVSDKQFLGIVKFANFPMGTSTIYARMKDEVDNLSEIASKSFVIKESLTLLVLDIKDLQRDIESIDKSMKIDIKDSSREMKINENDRGVLDGSK